MSTASFSITFIVEQSPGEVFNAINNVRGWWSEELEGSSEKLHDEFSYRHGTFHYSRHKLIEVEQDKKVVWLTTDSKLTFVAEQQEWNGTTMIFEISTLEDKSQLVITHNGLLPSLQCYEGCSKGWTHYLQNSLLPLITAGVGKPDRKQ